MEKKGAERNLLARNIKTRSIFPSISERRTKKILYFLCSVSLSVRQMTLSTPAPSQETSAPARRSEEFFAPGAAFSDWPIAERIVQSLQAKDLTHPTRIQQLAFSPLHKVVSSKYARLSYTDVEIIG